MRVFNRWVIQGASVTEIFISVVGMRRSRPVSSTSWKIFHMVSQLYSARIETQFIELRYLPSSNLWLSRRSRFFTVFFLVALQSLIFGVTTMVLWSERPKGGDARGGQKYSCKFVNNKSNVALFLVETLTICLSRKCFNNRFIFSRLKSPARIIPQLGNSDSIVVREESKWSRIKASLSLGGWYITPTIILE